MMTHVRSVSGGGCVLQGVCAHTERMVCGTLLGFQSASASWPYTALVTAGSSLDPRHSAQVSPITTHYVQARLSSKFVVWESHALVLMILSFQSWNNIESLPY